MQISRNPLTIFFKVLQKPKNRNVVVFLMRGGLGNQLHQIAGLTYLLNRRDSIFVIYDYDLFRSKRDGHSPRYLNYEIYKWFGHLNQNVFVARGSLQIFIRFLLSLKRRFSIFQIFNENNIEDRKNVGLYFLQDYFMNIKYLEFIDPPKIIEVLEENHLKFNSDRDIDWECNLHIRLQDYLFFDKDPLQLEYYLDAISILNLNPKKIIRVSLTILMAQRLCF